MRHSRIDECPPKGHSKAAKVEGGWKREYSWYRCPVNIPRYLHSNLGRPWDTVYSELRSRFTSKTDLYYFDHYWMNLEYKNYYREEDSHEFIIYRDNGYKYYVEDGILLHKKIIYKHRGGYKKPQETLRHKNFYKKNGIWYILVYENVKNYKGEIYMGRVWDVYRDEFITSAQRRNLYGDENIYCRGMKQLSKRELTNNRLVNGKTLHFLGESDIVEASSTKEPSHVRRQLSVPVLPTSTNAAVHARSLAKNRRALQRGHGRWADHRNKGRV